MQKFTVMVPGDNWVFREGLWQNTVECKGIKNEFIYNATDYLVPLTNDVELLKEFVTAKDCFIAIEVDTDKITFDATEKVDLDFVIIVEEYPWQNTKDLI